MNTGYVFRPPPINPYLPRIEPALLFIPVVAPPANPAAILGHL